MAKNTCLDCGEELVPHKKLSKTTNQYEFYYKCPNCQSKFNVVSQPKSTSPSQHKATEPSYDGAILFMIIMIALGVLLCIPSETQDFGYGIEWTSHPYMWIGMTLISISWLPLAYIWYKHFLTNTMQTFARAQGESIGSGISKGMSIGSRVCPKCNLINPATARFCNDCGKRLIE
jgi:DNA-directed RNA polymerase subunit RPC12/RpoP